MMDEKCPCTQDCPSRSATCHATCDGYAKYAAYRREKCAENLKEREKETARRAAVAAERIARNKERKGGNIHDNPERLGVVE